MKKTFLFIFAGSLLATSGCLVAEGGGWRGHGHRHSGVIVGPPVIVAPVPVLIVP